MDPEQSPSIHQLSKPAKGLILLWMAVVMAVYLLLFGPGATRLFKHIPMLNYAQETITLYFTAPTSYEK